MKKSLGKYWMHILCVSVLSLMMWSSAAFATTVLYLDLAKLIEASDVIVRGTIDSSEFKFDNERGNVMTHYTVTVNETYYGKTDKTLKFTQWGGMWKGMASRIPGDAKFDKGEDTILFLNESKGTLYLTALGQSKYSVKKVKGKTLVTRNLSDIGFFVEGDKVPEILGKEAETVELDSFIPELQSLIAAIKGGLK